jgi:uncharacterized protein YggT (Ycf19 family)
MRNITINVINFFVTLAEGFLTLRFILKLFGANASNSFVNWIYDMSSVLIDPFRGIFSANIVENKYILEFSTLFAMLVYLLIGLLAMALVDTIAPASKSSHTKK